MTYKVKKREELARLRESLAQDLLAQSDEEVLELGAESGIDAGEARSRVLDAFRRAKEAVTPKKRPTLLRIDATRARNILRRVAQRAPVDTPAPLLEAAQLESKKNDAEVLKVVAELRTLGVVSDDELK